MPNHAAITVPVPARRLVAIYVRISKDRLGDEHGVHNQLEECEALCLDNGWTEYKVYKDNDRSAFNGDERPEYDRLLADIAAGRVDTVVVWNNDRLHRVVYEWGPTLKAVRKGWPGPDDSPWSFDPHFRLIYVKGGDVDLNSAAGLLTENLMGSLAQMESHRKRERAILRNIKAASSGKLTGGGNRPFGYNWDRVTLNEPEADLIREAAARVLRGEALYAICKDWRARDVRTPTGRPRADGSCSGGNHFRPGGLKAVLVSYRVSGRRARNGVLVSDTACWPGIISIEESERLRALLLDPSRRANADHNGTRRHVLAGFLWCAHCKVLMRTFYRGKDRAEDRRRSYACSNLNTGCAQSVSAVAVEEYVRDMVCGLLSKNNLAEHRARRRQTVQSVDEAKLRQDIAEAEEDLNDLQQANIRGEIRPRVVLPMIHEAQARLDALERQLLDLTADDPAVEHIGKGEEYLRDWDSYPLDKKRTIIGVVVDRIYVSRATRVGNTFDSDRLDPDFL